MAETLIVVGAALALYSITKMIQKHRRRQWEGEFYGQDLNDEYIDPIQEQHVPLPLYEEFESPPEYDESKKSKRISLQEIKCKWKNSRFLKRRSCM